MWWSAIRPRFRSCTVRACRRYHDSSGPIRAAGTTTCGISETGTARPEGTRFCRAEPLRLQPRHDANRTRAMSRYLLRRLLIAVPSLIGISIVLFTVFALAPGDPFGELATTPNGPPEVGAALRAKFGLDDPVWLRYLRWLIAMLHGDWGFSFVSRVDVDRLILQRLPATLLVIGSSQVLALLVALPVGVLAATRPYSLFDQVANTFAFIGFSLPTFFTGILFILIFSIYLDWLPFVFRADIAATGWRWYWEMFRQAIMPVAVLGLFQGASWTRYVRSAVLDVIRLDYVTTARAKGIAERAVITRHVVRNALIPVVTLVALSMPAVFGGAIVTEQIFRVPGIGSLLISSILANDTPVIMAVTFVFACLVILFNLFADILYGWLDPRISYRLRRDWRDRPGAACLARHGGVAALSPSPAGGGGERHSWPRGGRRPGGAGGV